MIEISNITYYANAKGYIVIFEQFENKINIIFENIKVKKGKNNIELLTPYILHGDLKITFIPYNKEVQTNTILSSIPS